MKVVICVWLIQLLLLAGKGFAISDNPSSDIIVDDKTYENCMVRHKKILITSEETHVLQCFAGLDRPENVAIFVVANHGHFARVEGIIGILTFRGYHQDYTESMIDVAFKVDQGSTYKSSWVTNLRLTDEEDIFRYAQLGPFFPKQKNHYSNYLLFLDTFLAALAQGQNLYTRVGDRAAIIPLQGAAAAIDDFTSRIADLKFK